MSDAGNELVSRWRRWSSRPGGRWAFGRLLGLAVPYAGTISPDVVEIAPGRARVRMKDRRRVRNHLRSVHAAALFNLGEMTANTALTAAQPAGVRWIPIGSTIAYVKKARGTLEAISELGPIDWGKEQDLGGEARILDEAGDLVARVEMTWRVSPRAG